MFDRSRNSIEAPTEYSEGIFQAIRRGVASMPEERLLSDRELQLGGVPLDDLLAHAEVLIQRGELGGTVTRLPRMRGLLVKYLTAKGREKLREGGEIGRHFTPMVTGSTYGPPHVRRPDLGAEGTAAIGGHDAH